MTTAQGSKPTLTIRFHLTDGSIHSFVQTHDTAARKLWEGIDPARLFARPRIVIGSAHSKAVFVSAETIRVDFIQDAFQRDTQTSLSCPRTNFANMRISISPRSWPNGSN